MTPSPAIEFQRVTKVYQHRLGGQSIPALTEVSFSVLPGEVCAFLGPNGAGKTTSISLLMGFMYADAGEIRILGYEPGDVRAKRQIGFLPENFAFYKYLNAEKLLRFHYALGGGHAKSAGPLIADLLRQVRLEGYEKLKIGKYSRGMVQRLGIAQAILADPQLLILDEPTSGLDPAGRKEVRDLIVALKAAGKTIFLSSHILSEIEQICDRVIIIDRGRMIRAGEMNELLRTNDLVEIRADQLPASLEPTLLAWGATNVLREAHSVRIVLPVAHKRDCAELLWASGCDVLSIVPQRSSLEELFLQSVGPSGAPS
ncbi:MAG TPA: ABC transporter ATP-binding protein [Verrucomicrobiae bacterium]|nr:ABC transporter ATP-binding protein [Verrucomicrobiae bacterium]